MKSDLIAKAVALLGPAPAPACVTTGGGKLIFANRTMKSVMRNGSANVFKCQWLARRPGESCPECAEAVVVEGRCFFTGQDKYRLAVAVRLAVGGGALARMYVRQGKKVNAGVQKTVDHLLSMGVSDKIFLGNKSVSDQKDPLLAPARLFDLTEAAIAAAGQADSAENLISKKTMLKATSPLVMCRAISCILEQLALAAPKGSVKITCLSRSSWSGKSGALAIVFELHSDIMGAKALKSRLGALSFRFRSFFSMLPRITGYSLGEPEIFNQGQKIEVHLYIPDPLEPAGLGAAAVNGALTARELEILEITRLGCDNRAICSILDISEYTVKQHLKSLYRKFDVNSRMGLIFESWGRLQG